MAGRTNRRSNLAVILLTLLAEEPMHPYLMQRRINGRGKGNVVNVAQRNSVYQTIDRLLRAELITVHEIEQEERRPERTVYAITDLGERTLRTWLREMLSAPAREFPEFPAALASLMVLTPDDVREHLQIRAEALAAEVAELDRLRSGSGTLPRLLLLDDEHRRTLAAAELEWVRGVVAALDAGELDWDYEGLRALAVELESSP